MGTLRTIWTVVDNFKKLPLCMASIPVPIVLGPVLIL